MEKITVLLPGGFKPPHMGHLKLANKFANNPMVSKVIVMVGPAERDGINRQQSLTVWNLLPTHPKVKIIGVSEENPMNAAFNYVFNLPKDSVEIIALGASAKSPEDAKRSQIFVAAIDRYKNKPTKDGKTAPKGVKAVDMTDDVPSNYIGRTDDKNGKSISASILRQDIQNKDFENFITNYPTVKTGIVKSIYNILKKSITSDSKKKIKERIKNILINIIKEQDDEDVVNSEKIEKSAEVKKALSDREWRRKKLKTSILKQKVNKEKQDEINKKIAEVNSQIRELKLQTKVDVNSLKNKQDEIIKLKDQLSKLKKELESINNQIEIDKKMVQSTEESLKAATKAQKG